MGDDQASEVDDLVTELRLVRRAGLRALGRLLPDLPVLSRVSGETYSARDSMTVEVLLTDAWRQLGNGPHGQVIGILLGLAPGRRGGSPAALREAATRELGYSTVETFRKAPEARALEDLAVQILSIRSQRRARTAENDDRVTQIVEAIEQLSSLELAELGRRLATRLGPLPPKV